METNIKFYDLPTYPTNDKEMVQLAAFLNLPVLETFLIIFGVKRDGVINENDSFERWGHWKSLFLVDPSNN
jgi:hypothetical protein